MRRMSIFGVVLSTLMISACDCSIEGERSYGHYVGSYGVLIIDETAYGISGELKEDIDNSILSLFDLQEEYGLSHSVLLTSYSHVEIHIRDDYIPCRYGRYECHTCSAVGYLSNGGPFLWVSTIDNCSTEYLIVSQLDRLIPESLGYDYRDYNLIEDNCGAQINRCALARRRLERTTVYDDYCNE